MAKPRQERHLPRADAAPLGLKARFAHVTINITPLRSWGMATTTKSVSARRIKNNLTAWYATGNAGHLMNMRRNWKA